MSGYTRQSAASIVALAEITAAPLNAEFNQLQSAFNGTTGHTHGGGSGDAPLIPLTTSVTGTLPVANGGTGAATHTAGILIGNGTAAIITRVLTGTAAEITVTNGSGVSGAPTLSLPTALTFTGKTVTGGTFASPTMSGTLTLSGTLTVSGTSTGGTYTASAFNGTLGATTPSTAAVTTLSGTGALSGFTTGAFSSTVSMTGLTATTGTFSGAVSMTGLTATTGIFSGAVSMAGLTATTGSFSGAVTITSGSITGITDITVADGGTGASTFTGGLLVGNGTSAIISRVLTGTAAEITVTNGSGVSGAPTISLPSALTFTGKTVTGGTYASGAFNGTLGATTPSTAAVTTLTASSTAVITGGLTANGGISTTAIAGSSTLSGFTTGSFSSSVSATIFTASTEFRSSVGSAADPSYTFTGNGNTGLFADTANVLSIACNSAETARFSTTALIVGSDAQITITDTTVGWSVGKDGHAGSVVTNDSCYGMRRLGGVGGVIQTFVDGLGVSCGSIATSSGATAYNTSSDGTLKTNIRPIKRASEIIDNLNPVKFDWIKDGKSGYGFIAQEAEKVFPHAVSKNDEGIYGMDYSKLVPVILAELKLLRARVAELEAK